MSLVHLIKSVKWVKQVSVEYLLLKRRESNSLDIDQADFVGPDFVGFKLMINLTAVRKWPLQLQLLYHKSAHLEC